MYPVKCTLSGITILLFLLFVPGIFRAQEISGRQLHPFNNQVTVDYLRGKLAAPGPKLVLTPESLDQLREMVKSDSVTANVYSAIKLNAYHVMQTRLLERVMQGKRLLKVSRELLYRLNVLSMTYLVEEDPKVLARIDAEINTVCKFPDWNPSHFLDVAEMAMGISLALDWVGDRLPGKTVARAKTALIKKGIWPSYAKHGGNRWVGGDNNWNQVCHAGMVAASLVVFDRNPDLATRTIRRALDSIPRGLTAYAPDGVYPEGPSYWAYGTAFTAMTAAMFQSALGSDFGIPESPGFLESAQFLQMCTAPSKWFYNFSDCGDKRGPNGNMILAWFATYTGDGSYFERERFLASPEQLGKLNRLAGAGLVWISQFRERTGSTLPMAWKGDGENPIVVFRGPDDDPRQYYFGGKGGKGELHHGNMDAGSFVFELNGVRWSIDPGSQRYYELEKTGFDLWKRCQTCQRWTLLTKNNFGHSTLTVNDSLHRVDGQATLVDFKGGERPEATFDLSASFGDMLRSARRSFIMDGPSSLIIEDKLVASASTREVVWQLMTQADVEIVDGGAILRQDGQELRLENQLHPEILVSVISLDPPPLELDKHLTDLKRIELRIPSKGFEDGELALRVRLVGE